MSLCHRLSIFVIAYVSDNFPSNLCPSVIDLFLIILLFRIIKNNISLGHYSLRSYKETISSTNSFV